MIEFGAWIFFGLSLLIGVSFAYLYVTAYIDRHAFTPPHIAVATVALGIAVGFALLLPVDVCAVDSSFDVGSDFEFAYFVMLLLTLICAMIFLPATYTLCQQKSASDEFRDALFAALLRSLPGICTIVIVYSLATLFPRPSSDFQETPQKLWIDRIHSDVEGYEEAMSFALGILGSIGFIHLCLYLGNGLVSFPMGVLTYKQQFTQPLDDAQEELTQVIRRIQQIDSRYTLTGKKLPKKERAEMDELRKREKLLSGRVSRLESTTFTWFSRFVLFVEPMMYYIGIVLLLCSVLVAVSLSVSLLDRSVNHICTTDCGFVVEEPIWSPLDQFLVAFADFYPLDYIVYIIFIFHVITSIVSGINERGVWMGRNETIYPSLGATPVRDMFLVTGVVIFSLVGSYPFVYTIIPQYSTYGSQRFSSYGEDLPCTISVTDPSCTLTEFAQIHHQISTQFVFAGYLHLVGLWFVVASFLYALLRRFRDSLISSTASTEYKQIASPSL